MLESVSGKVRSMLPEVLSSSGGSRFGEVVSQAFRQAAAHLGSSAADMLKKAVAVFPNGIFSLFIGTVSFLYLTADMDGIGKSITSLMTGFLGEERSHAISRTFSGFTDAVFTYLRSYLLLTLITFSELSAGFLVIGLERPFSAAFAAAIIDALPLLGCGIVLIPWSVWCFIDGNISRGVILIVLQIIIYAVRQFAEPRVFGKNLGIHPIISLILLYLGYYFFGLMGLLLIPLMTVIINALVNKDNSAQVEKGAV
jgi:sporulation integral membrane protein YtvI